MWLIVRSLLFAILMTAVWQAPKAARACAGFEQAVAQAQAMLPQSGRLGGLPPLAEMITSPFGPRRMPGWLSRRGLVARHHSGLDIRARLGWPVIAFKGGVVSHAGPHGLSGIVAEIKQDDGMTARYAHLEKTLVKKGQRVETGTAVGLVGCTGRTTGSHLHFGLQNRQGKAIDPLPHLRSAAQVLRPAPEQIPAALTPQSCGPVVRGRDGRPRRLGRALQELDAFVPPPLPRWEERR